MKSSFLLASEANMTAGKTAPLQQPQIKCHYGKWWRKPNTRSFGVITREM